MRSALDESQKSLSDSVRLPLAENSCQPTEAKLQALQDALNQESQGIHTMRPITAIPANLSTCFSQSNGSMQEETSSDRERGSLGAENGSETSESAPRRDDGIQEMIEESKQFMKEVVTPPLVDPLAQKVSNTHHNPGADLERGTTLLHRDVEEVQAHRSFCHRLTVSIS